GEPLSPKKFDNIKHMKSFCEQYKGVDNFKIYGTASPAVQMIAKVFKEPVDYNLNHIRIFSLDIETMSDEGFPDPKMALSKITAITINDRKNDIFHVWGVKPFVPHKKNIVYREFSL